MARNGTNTPLCNRLKTQLYIAEDVGGWEMSGKGNVR